ncbi:1-deoxy-D-xylulose-5-phosphate synthase [Tannockella kyphosi]|uniref:1-deoxy-D-xylulose-5-phosphate synthase n=1 Tax=Tannockella kyphosi TaxID=2899121 RepID=UPI0020124728|nr:1-deoxy-D-xylulose-5-phosphate synthase [Tannockella kyphosi]
MDLTKIESPEFLKTLDDKQLNDLADSIRTFLIENISKTGGHLSSNLGIVELTIALHLVFDSPNDKIFFDVGHQSYVHKILTGRAKYFPTLRKTDGLSGFQKTKESKHDVWEAGHSSTALSGAIGMAVARDLKNENFHVVPVVGDGAMLSGPSLEALNHIASLNNKVILILNDNHMSIGSRVGNVEHFLSNIRISNTYNHLKKDYRNLLSGGNVRNKIFTTSRSIKEFFKKSLIKHTMFDDFGLSYIGPIDGHDINELKRALNFAKESKESIVVHIHTQKGKGYVHAVDDKCGKWHGIGPFDIESGQSLEKVDENKISWSKVVSNHMNTLMAKDDQIVAVTPAMVHGSKMTKLFHDYPDRCFDVGIAEEHAVTFVAGLSIQGAKPFLSVYSSFIQRAYDQMNHDIARMNLPSFICIDRCGIVGSDGPTHHGVFDIGMFLPVPNLTIFAPRDANEALSFMDYAFDHFDRPYMMRISRNSVLKPTEQYQEMVYGKWLNYKNNDNPKVIIITYGDNVDVVEMLLEQEHIPAYIVNARFLKPIDTDLVNHLPEYKLPIIVYETDLQNGGLFTQLTSYYSQNHKTVSISSVAIGDHYSIAGSVDDIYRDEKIDKYSLLEKIKEVIS